MFIVEKEEKMVFDSFIYLWKYDCIDKNNEILEINLVNIVKEKNIYIDNNIRLINKKDLNIKKWNKLLKNY